MHAGRWECGLRHGRGKERSQYGTYDGEWVSDQKQGHGQERSLVGTTYEGTWERNWKHGRGIKKMVFGATEEQVNLSTPCFLQSLFNRCGSTANSCLTQHE